MWVSIAASPDGTFVYVTVKHYFTLYGHKKYTICVSSLHQSPAITDRQTGRAAKNNNGGTTEEEAVREKKRING